MDIAEIEQTLHDVAKLRMPRFKVDPNDPMGSTRPGDKIEQLETYLLDVAYARGSLEEARLYAYGGVQRLTVTWDRMTGWEEDFSSPEKAARATQPQIAEAKRQLDPELYESIEKGKFLVKRLTDQIKRLEKDEEVASRAYTLISHL